MKNLNLKEITLITLLPILSLIIGFICGEDLSTGGSELDFNETFPAVVDFANNKIDEFYLHTRHFPFHYFLLSIPQRFFESILITKIFYLLFSLLIPIFIYLNLNLLFPSNKINNLIISFTILFVPYFRASAIWANAHMTAIIFLIVSNYFFLLFQKKKDNFYIYLNLFFLSLSTYSIQSYSIFFIYFLVQYFREIKFINFFLILFFCFLLSIPGIYLTLLTPLGGKLNFTENISYTLLNNLSIIFFFFLFFILNLQNIGRVKKFFYELQVKEIVLILFLYIILILNYEIPQTLIGGGFFYKVSLFVFNTNYFFFLICFLSIFTIYLIFKLEKNLFFLIFLANLTATGYITSQKYFEPLVIVLILIFCKNFLNTELIFKKKNIIIFYIINISYYLVALLNSIYNFSKNTYIS